MFWKSEIVPRRVLITGGSGFLGSYVVEAAMKHGLKITDLSRTRHPLCQSHVTADLSKGPPDLESRAFERVFHLAGLAHVIRGKDHNHAEFDAVNVQGAKNLLKGIERSCLLPDSLVFVSSVAVYGLETGSKIKEEAPRIANDPYGESKRIAEDIFIEWGCRTGVRIVIVRLPLVAGFNPPGNLGAMISGLERFRYFGIGKGDARRSIVLASDVAPALIKVSEMNGVFGVFNLTDGYDPRLVELENCLCRGLGCGLPKRIPYRAAKLLAYAGDFLRLVRVGAPFDSQRFRKLTSSLTFSDQNAREAWGWNPRTVIDHEREIVGN